MEKATLYIQSELRSNGVIKVNLLMEKDKDMENRPTPKVSTIKVNSKMISNTEKEWKLQSKKEKIPNQDKIFLYKKIDMKETSNTDTKKEKESNIQNMANIRANGTKALNTAKEPSNTKRAIHIRDNGPTTANMVKVPIFNLSSLMAKKSLINTPANLRKASTMERELWNIGTEISMMVNGPLVKNKARECINGQMETITMALGKKTLHKVQVQHALVVSSTMVSSI